MVSALVHVVGQEEAAERRGVARRVAQANGVDLGSVKGTGTGGKITKADVLAAGDGDGAAPAAPPAASMEGDAKALRGPAAMLAKAMEESRSIPTATSFRTLAVDTLDAKRKALNGVLKEQGLKISFTHLIGFAAGHEIIRQRKRDLVLARLTPDLVYDQMIAAGCARKLVFSWAGNPGAGSLFGLRRAVEEGVPAPLELEEYSHFGMVARFTAGASKLPFAALRTFTGSDLARVNPAIREVVCPYTGERIPTVPALNPDVAIVHVQRASADDQEAATTRVPNRTRCATPVSTAVSRM